MPNLEPNSGACAAWNDAVVYGDVYSPETQRVLNSNYDVLVGRSSKQRRGTWLGWTAPLHEMINLKLSRHEAKTNKDGDAIVFARSKPSGGLQKGRAGGHSWPLCGRARAEIEAVTFAGYDIDDGDALKTAIERLSALGYFAIVYTTHSHGKTRSERSQETIDKYRILFPLHEPFELAPDNPVEHEDRCHEWRERLINFAEQKLDLVIDESGCDVNRLFYTPRHKPGDKNWYSAIFAGQALRIDDMPYTSTTVRPRQRSNRRSDQDHPIAFSGKRPILSDGFDLIDWYRVWGAWFLVRDFFEVLQWEIGHDIKARREARILCPNDHAHSSPDDRDGCWIKDGSGTTPFMIYCHHDSCREMGPLDQLVELEHYVALPDEYDTLSAMLCDPMFYSCYLNEDDGDWPDRLCYLRWDPQTWEAEDSADAKEQVFK